MGEGIAGGAGGAARPPFAARAGCAPRVVCRPSSNGPCAPVRAGGLAQRREPPPTPSPSLPLPSPPPGGRRRRDPEAAGPQAGPGGQAQGVGRGWGGGRRRWCERAAANPSLLIPPGVPGRVRRGRRRVQGSFPRGRGEDRGGGRERARGGPGRGGRPGSPSSPPLSRPTRSSAAFSTSPRLKSMAPSPAFTITARPGARSNKT